MHALEREVCLAHDLRLICERQLTVFHDNASVNDGRSHTTSIRCICEMRQNVCWIPGKEWREHGREGVNDDDIGLLACRELTTLMA